MSPEWIQVWLAGISVLAPIGLGGLALYVSNQVNHAKDEIIAAVKLDFAGREVTERRISEVERRLANLESTR